MKFSFRENGTNFFHLIMAESEIFLVLIEAAFLILIGEKTRSCYCGARRKRLKNGAQLQRTEQKINDFKE